MAVWGDLFNRPVCGVVRLNQTTQHWDNGTVSKSRKRPFAPKGQWKLAGGDGHRDYYSQMSAP